MVLIKVPDFGESITEATIVSWIKKENDYVEEDDPLVELETDKVTTELVATASGVLHKIYFKEGSIVKIGELLVDIDDKAQPKKVELKPSTNNTVDSTPKTTSPPPAPGPAASKIIAENNIKQQNIQGTGKHSQVTKQDIISHLEEKNKPVAMPNNTSKANNNEDQKELEKVVPMTRLRQVIAKRLVEAQQTAAILTTFNEVNLEPIMKLRSKYNDLFLKKYNSKIGFMSFFTKASIDALKQFPAINAEISGTNIIYKHYYHIGVAVGGPKGLVVPVIKNADILSLIDIELKIKEFVNKINSSTIQLSELDGGTFTISNGGVYGSMLSTPILNPPQTGILGMHNVVERPVVINKEIVIRPMMYLALSYDHRMVDGKEAVQFLVRIKECLEDPTRLILGI